MLSLKEIIKNGDVIGLLASRMNIDFFVIYKKEIYEITFFKNSDKVKIRKLGEKEK
jgi:hypothetical protein